MTFWEMALVVLAIVWAFMIGLAVFGAGVPLLREKIRKKRRTGK